MFIHYGLYSIPAGVFNGQPVERGYSEQILTFGIGFSDWYEAYTRDFTAENFDAEEIVSLAKAGGMRSIVITSKHHDGFCLFDTKTTDYNTVKATPAGRDLLKELSDACHREGIGFGIYFSLIDWHYPYAMPFTSHNADPITPPHHEYNKAQVEELLTQYGKVDELWFDMGSLTREQSAELYQLVHSLQPDCMVSGRLGNDFADFSVMADNEYPDYMMQMPWQTAASMFDETWGYRSWQERGEVEDKVKEKLESLIKVVAYGGKYLLNIGPKGDGSIVPFEEEVIKRIGEEIEPIKEAIYNTLPAPSGVKLFDSKYVTMSNDSLIFYLFYPIDESVTFNVRDEDPFEIEEYGHNNYYKVFKVLLKDRGPLINSNKKPSCKLKTQLSPYNAELLYAHSSADYYASFKSIVGYRWRDAKGSNFKLTYTEAEKCRAILINDESFTLKPDKAQTIKIPKDLYTFGSLYSTVQRGRFANVSNMTAEKWTELEYNLLTHEIMRNLGFSHGELYKQRITAQQALDLPVEIKYKDGAIIYLNGNYIDGAWTRAESGDKLFLLLPLQKGENELIIKLYNRWGYDATLSFRVLDSYKQYEQNIKCTDILEELIISKERKQPLASPAHLSSLRIKIE